MRPYGPKNEENLKKKKTQKKENDLKDEDKHGVNLKTENNRRLVVLLMNVPLLQGYHIQSWIMVLLVIFDKQIRININIYKVSRSDQHDKKLDKMENKLVPNFVSEEFCSAISAKEEFVSKINLTVTRRESLLAQAVGVPVGRRSGG